MGTPSRLTALVLTHNEEDMIEDCLAGLSWADETLVVDSFSEDRTVELAEKAGARVLRRAFEGFAGQYNWGVEQAGGDWVLIVDADERVTPELRDAIRRVLAEGPAFEVYNVVRDAFFLGRLMKSKAWSGEPLPRLFRKGKLRYSGLVHSTIDFGGLPAGRLDGKLLHHTYRSMEQYFEKSQTYTSLAAREDLRKGRRIGIAAMFAAAGWRFFHNFFLRGGFLDGRVGLLTAGLAAVYTFSKHAKLWGLRDRERLDAARKKH